MDTNQVDFAFVADSLVRAMIPHVRYNPSDEMAMAREASTAQSYEVKQALLCLLYAGFFSDLSSFVESAIDEYNSMRQESTQD